MAQKGNIRSIRISDQMAELIDQQVGSNFTEKWENLVTRCVWELPKAEERLLEIQRQIQYERDRLHSLHNLYNELYVVFKGMEKDMGNLTVNVHRAINKLDS